MAGAKLTVGNVEIIAQHDNEAALPLAMTFPDVPPEAWTSYQQKYPEGFNGTDNLRIHFECYLIRSAAQTILMDTGAGSMATNVNQLFVRHRMTTIAIIGYLVECAGTEHACLF